MFRITLYSLLYIVMLSYVSPSDIQLIQKHYYIPTEMEMKTVIGEHNTEKCLARVCITPQAYCTMWPKGCDDCCFICINQGGGWVCSEPGYPDKDCSLYGGTHSCGQLYKGDCVPAGGYISECIPVYGVGFCGFLYNNCSD